MNSTRSAAQGSGEVLIVYAHPRDTSYTNAMMQRARDALTSRGAAVTVLDLWASGFDPAAAGAAVSDAHIALLRSARTLVLVYPTWWSGQPAILTGWLAALPDDALRSVTRIVAVTSHGSPRWVNVLEGQTGRSIVRSALRARCAPGARVEWIAVYGMDRIDERARRAFLDRIERQLSRR